MCKQRSTRTEIRANLSFFGYKKDKPKKTKRNRLLSVSMSVQFWRFQKKKTADFVDFCSNFSL